MRPIIAVACMIAINLLGPNPTAALETHSVCEFGADGNGDNTESIQRAIDFAMSNPCKLVFPGHQYLKDVDRKQLY